MKFKKVFTNKGQSPYDQFSYTKRKSILRNPDGSLVFEMNNIEVPEQWSQLASDILAQKYFRKTGVPQFDEAGNKVLNDEGTQSLGSENSIKQVVHRMAGAWRHWGEKYNYFDSKADAQNFYDETAYMLLNQMCAPNSPQWFNTGLNFAYNIKGSKQGHFYVEPETATLKVSEDAYTRPQPHACFIQSVNDDLVGENGIFDLATREARIFKYGSGTGTNFSDLRGSGEKLSGGGYSSGLMSFLKIFDRAAGAIKSGGTTRRAAKMVIIDIDHPDVEEFIEWKAKEEDKVAALVAGSKVTATFMQAILDEAVLNGTDRKVNKKLNTLIKKSVNRGIPLNHIKRLLDLVNQGFTSLNFPSFDTHYEGEAYITVSGQNSNNSVRLTNDFLNAVENDELWELKWRTDRTTAKVIKARDLWDKINMSSWKSADPGLQFDTTINEWHTCPNSGRINASNPCSEYMFLDDTACNLASLNLMKFYDEENQIFRVEEFKHAVNIWTVILEISVLMAQFPSVAMAERSFQFRTLGLGYANIGTLLMVNGIPYDSPEALSWTGAISAIMTGESYATSALLAKELGAFPGHKDNEQEMLKVIRNHRRAAYNATPSEYEDLTIRPRGINPKYVPDYLLVAAKSAWDNALNLGTLHGYRNAQTTVIAPTGTIGLVMDCDTTGIEPDFAMIKYKKLAGGGYFKIVNQSVRKALTKLNYTEQQIEDIEKYCKGSGSLVACPYINKKTLKDAGFTDDKIEIIEKQLDNVFDIKFAFNKWVLGEDFIESLGFTAEQYNNSSFNLLKELGFSGEEIDVANDYVCGTMMIEGAPHIKDEHLPIFDTANKCGKRGRRYIDYMAHVRIMSAAQPFISGAISKTVNMPNEATVNQIGDVHITSWKMMLKAIAIYRDGSKLSQPLNSSNYSDIDEVVQLGDENTLDETLGPKEVQEIIVEKINSKPTRTKLPKKRHGFIREAIVGGHKVFLRTGEYADGSLGEIFIDMYKEGASFRGLLNSFAILASKALQYGVPLDELVDTFTFTRFEPAGMVDGHDAIKNATSILDYVFRSLGYDYLGRTDFVHIKAVDEINGNNNVHSPALDILLPQVHSEKISTEVKNDVVDNKPELSELTIFEESEIITSSKQNVIVITSRKEAKSFGYTGEPCSNCGSMRVKRNGSCTVCDDCGTTSGCS
ncbi:MAG TPA: vitamin B12-dependent ribonucleotide reductase [Candidatus Kapabacteria bacterium]|nr:vitamin B12-dependent ribonucleotide reductase [Candidatus Kapabacteria bacterium]